MTEQELAEIEARHKASTAGEWRTGPLYCDISVKIDDIVTETICTLLDGKSVFNSNSIRDADFIAHAHNTDIPALLTEVRRLREENQNKTIDLMAEITRLQLILKQAKCKHPYYREDGDLHICIDCGSQI